MDLRIFTEPQQGASYDDLLRVAKATEDLGFDAFFRSDHILAMGDGDGQPGPTDAWLTLAALGRETSRIRLGTLVTAATFRHPAMLAISVAQADQMSGGRVELGLGTGWFEEEHRAFGIPFPSVQERFDRLEEQLRIIIGLWDAEGTFSFEGKYWTLQDAPALPKPVQRPHPPIIIGGTGPTRTPHLAATYADEFNMPFHSLDHTAAQFARVEAACVRTGRQLVYSASQVLCVGRDEDEFRRRAAAIGREPAELRENGLAGTPAEVLDKAKQFAGIGAKRLYLQMLDLSDIAHLELVAAEIAPHL
ncbi:MAG: Luciferase-like monooxygenase [Frankiales bacterium]|nr:Luciferase-like monooxygenase [Frankiales bacterium]